MSKEEDYKPAAAQEAVAWQRRYKNHDEWFNISKHTYDHTVGGKLAEKYDVRELLASAPAAPGIDVTCAARISELEAQVKELDRLCDATYVAQGADAYNHACDMLEQFQAVRAAAGKEIGTEGSLCDAMAWLYGRLDELEAQIDASPKVGSDAISVEGTVVFERSEGAGKHCVCCPDSPAHVYGRHIEWEGKSRPDQNALDIAILEQVLYVSGNEGKRVRVTIDVPQATSAEVGAIECTTCQDSSDVPNYTTGHCENHKKLGGCPLHNLQCGYPQCDRRQPTSHGAGVSK